MVVLHLISGGEVGGSKIHLLSLVENMKNKNIKSIIVCLIKGRLYDEALEKGLDVRIVEQAGRFDLGIVSRIKDICISEKVDIVNCHGGRANFVGYFLRRKYSAKYVSTVHSDYRNDYQGNLYKTLFFSNINRFVLKSFDYYITVSENFRDMLASRGFIKDRIFVVYNGIDFNRQRLDCSREEIIEKYDIPRAGHYVTMVARFHPVKGHRVFLDACKSVLKSFDDVLFVLLGDGQIKNEIEDYAKSLGIQGNVIFPGFKKPDEFIIISDFTVLTSYTESFPLTILESAFYGRTVVSTDVGGISKLVEDKINGYLEKPGDSEGIADSMLELLNNPKKAEEFGFRLYEKAKNNFSIESLCKKYSEIYGTIADGGDDHEEGKIPWR